MKIGILGGSFDPVHAGHIALARAAEKELHLDRIYFVPARQSPLKSRTPSQTTERLALLRRALRSHPKFKISQFELRRDPPSFTIETLEFFRSRYPRAQLYFLLGSDALAGFKKWRDWKKILDLATLAAGRRSGEKISADLNKKTVWLKSKMPAVSSTAIRKSWQN